jgi:hypothetical protein
MGEVWIWERDGGGGIIAGYLSCFHSLSFSQGSPYSHALARFTFLEDTLYILFVLRMSINGPVPEETKFTHWRMGGEGCHSSSKLEKKGIH